MYYSYKVYSFIIESEIEFPEFTKNHEDKIKPDVHIIIGKTPKKLIGETIIKKVRHESTENKLLYHLEGACKMYVENGKTIIVEPEENADWDYIKNHVRGRGLAGIIQQRKLTVLHGSAIEHKNHAIVFIGKSGAGKSTTASAFIKKGYSYLTDDLALIKKNDNGIYHLHPAYPNLRLWEHALQLIDTSSSFVKGKPIRETLDKYFMYPKSTFIEQSIPISHIYILTLNTTNELVIEDIANVEKLAALVRYTFAKSHLDGLGGYPEQFKTLSYLIQETTIKVIKRPYEMDRIQFWKMMDRIENDFKFQ